MTLESSKILGGVGAILLLIGTIATTYTFGVLDLIGAILILIGLNGLANYYQDKAIFSWAIYSFIAGIVGVAVAAATGFYVVFDTSILKNLLLKLYPTWNGSWSTIRSVIGTTPTTSNITSSDVTPVLGAVFGILVILWVFLIVSAFFARRSLKNLSSKSTIGLFSTAGLLLIIGAFLTIIFIGFILLWVAVLLLAIAFFQIKPIPEQPIAAQTTPPPATPTPV